MNDMDYVAMGMRLRSQRRQMRMTQEELAEKAGISLSFLGHIERGSRKASLETLVSLSNALSISPDMLLKDSITNVSIYTPSTTTLRQRELINEISRVILEKFDC